MDDRDDSAGGAGAMGQATWETLREDARGFVPAETEGRGRCGRGARGSEFGRREAERAARVFGVIGRRG